MVFQNILTCLTISCAVCLAWWRTKSVFSFLHICFKQLLLCNYHLQSAHIMIELELIPRFSVKVSPLYSGWTPRGSYIKQKPLEYLSYIKQMPLEFLSYIKGTSLDTSGRTLSRTELSPDALTCKFRFHLGMWWDSSFKDNATQTSIP